MNVKDSPPLVGPTVLEKIDSDDILLTSIPQGDSKQPKDEEDLWTPEDTIVPPENLQALVELSRTSQIRSTCIEAMSTNTVGLGYDINLDENHADFRDSVNKQTELRATLEMLAARDLRLNRPGFTELMKAVREDEEGCGNAAIEVSRSRETGQIDGLFHVQGWKVRRKKDRDGYVIGSSPGVEPAERSEFYNFGEKVEYDKSGMPTTKLQRGKRWKRNELLIFRLYTSESRDYGLPRDIALAVDYAASKLATDWSLGFFDNSGVPPTLLFISGVESREGQRITYKVNRDLVSRVADSMKADSNRSTRVALIPVPPGTTTDQVQLGAGGRSEHDATYQDYVSSHRSRVVSSFRISPIFVSDVEQAGRYTAEVERAITLEQVFDPEQQRIEDELHHSLLADLGVPELRLKFKRLAVESDAAKRDSADRLAEQGYITRREYRAAHGMPPFPEGDGEGEFPIGFNDELLDSGLPEGHTSPLERVAPGDEQQGLKPGIGGREERQGTDYSEGERGPDFLGKGLPNSNGAGTRAHRIRTRGALRP